MKEQYSKVLPESLKPSSIIKHLIYSYDATVVFITWWHCCEIIYVLL